MGDPLRDVLSEIGLQHYLPACEDEYSGLVDERYSLVSENFPLFESEWFEEAGIWS